MRVEKPDCVEQFNILYKQSIYIKLTLLPLLTISLRKAQSNTKLKRFKTQNSEKLCQIRFNKSFGMKKILHILNYSTLDKR